MRYSLTLSNLALVATTVLIKDAFAAPYYRRDVVNENVVVTQLATVVQQADGSYVTQLPAAPAAPVAPVAPVAPAAPAAPAPTPDTALVQQVKADDHTDPSPAPASPAPATQTYAPASSGGSSQPASGGSSNPGNKRGLAYNDAGLLQDFLAGGSKISWAYSWGPTVGDVKKYPSGLEFVPMLHDLSGNDNNNIGQWSSVASAALSSGSTHLQYINEPDMDKSVGGCLTDATTAAAGYVTHMMPFSGKAKIGSPAVSSAEEPNKGLNYLKDFWSKCNNCKFDFVSVHWYGDHGQEQMLLDHLEKVRDAAKAEPNVVKDASGNPKIWLTEFGLNRASPDQIASFLETMQPKLDGLDYLERYAYQYVAENYLVSGGKPNVAGKVFAGLS